MTTHSFNNIWWINQINFVLLSHGHKSPKQLNQAINTKKYLLDMATGIPMTMASTTRNPSNSKPFTYLPMGMDFSELRSPSVAKRFGRQQQALSRNSMVEDSQNKVRCLPQWKKSMLSALKVRRFQPDFTIFLELFLTTVKTPQHPKTPPNLGKKR